MQIVAAGADHAEFMAVTLSPFSGNRYERLAGQVLAGLAVRVFHHLGGAALGNDLAAMDAGARAHVDQVIGGADGVFVMFDDDHRVADVAQTTQCRQQSVVVALVQADTGFVQHIQHPGQAGADLTGQADTLGFAT